MSLTQNGQPLNLTFNYTGDCKKENYELIAYLALLDKEHKVNNC